MPTFITSFKPRDMEVKDLLNKALKLEWLSAEEGIFLFENATTAELMFVGDKIKKHHVPHDNVTWIIDRNCNTTNVCIANCKFCNFYRRPGHEESYITSIDEYKVKIDELMEYGGNQLLLQGGHHPDLGLEFYVNLFKSLKGLYPNLKLHSLGPPEIDHVAKIEGMSHFDVLKALKEAGLDSLPGAGAEILDDRVRHLISNGKCTGKEWLDVMRAAHKLDITTSATMMFGHIETIQERMEHYVMLRQVQSEKPDHAEGFIAFIPWPFMDAGTTLRKLRRAKNDTTSDEYLRMIAMSRIMLPNVVNIQASWLTVGKQTAQVSLMAGANDWGSIMIEENVVSAAGAQTRFTAQGIQDAIAEVGFTPQFRTQEYEYVSLPKNIKQQVLDKETMIID